jgi:hypothetical protein
VIAVPIDDSSPRIDPRQRHLEHRFGQWNRRVVYVVAAVAFLGAVLPAPWGPGLAVGAVAVIIAAPMGRVTWLIAIWHRQGDRRFVAAGVTLLCVIAAGFVVAALRGG